MSKHDVTWNPGLTPTSWVAICLDQDSLMSSFLLTQLAITCPWFFVGSLGESYCPRCFLLTCSCHLFHNLCMMVSVLSLSCHSTDRPQFPRPFTRVAQLEIERVPQTRYPKSFCECFSFHNRLLSLTHSWFWPLFALTPYNLLLCLHLGFTSLHWVPWNNMTVGECFSFGIQAWLHKYSFSFNIMCNV